LKNKRKTIKRVIINLALGFESRRQIEVKFSQKLLNIQETIYFFFFIRWFRFKYRDLTELRKSSDPRIMIGLTPIINSKYWVEALKCEGFQAKSIISQVPKNNKREDFDILTSELFNPSKSPLRNRINQYKLFCFLIERFDVFHYSFNFTILDDCKYWFMEKKLLDYVGVKVLSTPFGSDAYLYNEILDKSLAHTMNMSVPDGYKSRSRIKRNIEYWSKKSDFIILSYMIESIPRWSTLPFSSLAINMNKWQGIKKKNYFNGKNGQVRIAHTPNFRGIKGTDFIIKAIEKLKKEDKLNIELILIENKSNNEVKSTLTSDVDILVEQLILTGHGLSAVEGMAAGIPVISNLEHENYTRVFRRFSNLDDLPIVSATPENIYENLKFLIQNPCKRNLLSLAGVDYVKRYHSYESIGKFFREVYAEVWNSEDRDMMNYYNIKSKRSPFYSEPRIDHGLFENKVFES